MRGMQPHFIMMDLANNGLFQNVTVELLVSKITEERLV